MNQGCRRRLPASIGISPGSTLRCIPQASGLTLDHVRIRMSGARHVGWISDSVDEICAGLAETPAAAETTHRFFSAPPRPLPQRASQQDRLPHRM
jgi:hypothetical protein